MSWRSPSTSHQLLPRSILLYTVQWHHLRVRTAGIQPTCMYPSHSSSDESVRHLIHTRRNVVLRHSGHHRRHVCSENKQVPVLHLSYPTTGYRPYPGGRENAVLPQAGSKPLHRPTLTFDLFSAPSSPCTSPWRPTQLSAVDDKVSVRVRGDREDDSELWGACHRWLFIARVRLI